MRPNQLLMQLAYDGKQAEQRLAKTVSTFEAGADRIDRKFANTNKRTVERFKSAAASARVFERELEKQSRQLDRIRGSLDPVFAATQRFNQQQELLNAAMRRGDLTGAEYKRLLSLLQAELDLVGSSANRAAAGVQNVANSSRRSLGQIQNTAFQVGDFAVQVGAGTSASIALGQQLPQLLGGFGALGAVMGAVVAIGIPLTRVLIGTGEKSATLDETIEALTSTIDDYSASLANAQTPTEELALKYGAAADAARQFFGVFREQAQFAAETALTDSIDKLVARFGEAALEISGKFGTLRDAQERQIALFDEAAAAARNADIITSRGLDDQALRLGDLIREVERYAETLGLTGGELIELSGAAQNLSLADTVEQTVEAAQELDAVLGSVQGKLEDEGGVLTDIRGKLAEIGIEAAKFEAELDKTRLTSENLADLIGDVSGGLDTAVGLANRLSASLGDAAVQAFNAARALAVARDQSISAGPDGAVNDVRERLTPNGTNRADIVAQVTLPARTSSQASRTSVGGRSGSGAQGQTNERTLEETAAREVRNLQQRIRELGKTKDEVAGLRVEYKLLEEARRKGIDLDKVSAESGKTAREVITETAQEVQKLNQELAAAAISQDQFRTAIDSISDAFADAIVNGESLRDSLRGIFNQIASDLISSGVQGLLGNLFSGALGGGGGGLGGLLGGLLSFEGGGTTPSGARSGGVDGRGGFPAILHPDETVIDHKQSSGGAGAVVTVNHQWNIAANGDASVRNIIRAEMPMIEQRTMAAVEEATRRGRIGR